MNTFQLCQPFCSHRFMEPSYIASCVPTALVMHEKMPDVQPSTPACWLYWPLTLGRKVTSRESNLSLSSLLVPAAVAQPPDRPSLCPCSQCSWGQPAGTLFFCSCRAPSDFLSSLALPLAHLNPCYWFPISDFHPALVAPLDRRESFLLHGFLLSKYFECMMNQHLGCLIIGKMEQSSLRNSSFFGFPMKACSPWDLYMLMSLLAKENLVPYSLDFCATSM